jgi:hypothetical protein
MEKPFNLTLKEVVPIDEVTYFNGTKSGTRSYRFVGSKGSQSFTENILKSKLEDGSLIVVKKYEQGGSIGDNFVVKLGWAGFSTSDSNYSIGEFVISDSDLYKLENEWQPSVSINVYDSTDKKNDSYKSIVNAIKSSKYGKIAKFEDGGSISAQKSSNTLATILFSAIGLGSIYMALKD